MPEKQKIIEVHIPSILGYEKVAMESAAAAAKIMGFHQSRIEDLKTAISEACSNAMEHGNRFKKDTSSAAISPKTRRKDISGCFPVTRYACATATS